MSVYLRKQYLKKGIHLSFVEAHYNAKTKNTVSKTIKNIGYVDDLKKTYVDPIAHYTEEAKTLSAASIAKDKAIKEEKIPRKRILKNLGCFLINSVYKNFEYQDVCEYLSFDKKIKYDLENVFRFLVFSQIVNPGSKQFEYNHKEMFLDEFNFSDDQLYDAIKIIGKNKKRFLEYTRLQLAKFYKMDLSTTYFDGTNIYFEIDRETDMLKRGPEKNNRHDPIIGLGLLMDANSIPIAYTTFPGNQSEQPEMHKCLNQLKKEQDVTGRTIIVADKGLNSGDNMYNAVQNGDGYIISQKVRGAKGSTLQWILDEKDYTVTKNEKGEVTFKIKHDIDDFPVKITSKLNGQKVEMNLKQKRVIFYSSEYAEKSKYERNKLIAKAKELINNPSDFNKDNSKDACTYIKEIHFTKDGEVATDQKLELNNELITKEEKLDGYYMIVTSETQLPDGEIIKLYRGLWEIEESFSIIKGVLKVRPVFAKTIEGIEAHLFVSFVSLLILRLLQKVCLKEEVTAEQRKAIEEANKKKKTHKIEINEIKEMPMKQIVNFIRSYQAVKINDKFFVVEYLDLIPNIEKITDLKLDKQCLLEANIKNFFKLTLQRTKKFTL